MGTYNAGSSIVPNDVLMHIFPGAVGVVVAGNLTFSVKSAISDFSLLSIIPFLVSLLLSESTSVVSMIIIKVQGFIIITLVSLEELVFPAALNVDKVLEIYVVEDIELVSPFPHITTYFLFVIEEGDITCHCLHLPLTRSEDDTVVHCLIIASDRAH